MKKSISYIFILLSGICWGCMGLSNRMLTQMGMGLGNRVFMRNFGTLVVLTVVFGLLHREVFRIKLRHLPIFLGSGLVSILLLSIVYFQCQTLCSLSVAAILLYLAPSFVVLISAVLWKTPLTGRKLAALGISLVGCVLVSGVLGGGATASLPGIALGVASGLCYASYTVFAHYGLARYESYTMIYWTFLVAGLGSIFFADFGTLPLAFASSMGGMMTLIGTPPNLVIQNTLTDAGYPSLSFFSFLPVGLICVVVGTIVLLPLSKMFLSKRGAESRTGKHSGKSLKELVHEYGLSDNLFRLRIPAKSVLKGKTIVDLDIRRRYGLNILEVRRGEASQHRFLKTITQKLAEPNTILQAEDILYVKGDFEQVNAWAAAHRLEILDGRASEDIRRDRSLDFYDIGIAEIVLMPASRIVNHTIKEIGFRDKFNVNVLGIRRKKEYLLQDLGDLRIHSGDVLLIQGTWSDISRLSKEDEDWVVLGEPLDEAAKVTLDYKAPLAAAIMILMVAMMVFDFIPVAPVTAVMIAGILMVLTGCFRNVEAAYKTINWESIVLIAAMLPMSLALEKTGGAEFISNSLVNGLGSYGPLALMAGIYFTTSLMTMFISNTATAVLLAPIALQSALQIGVSPVPFLFAVTLGASMCFASPFSTPPNALVMPAGQYTFMDYVKVGLPLQIIMGIVMIFVLPLLFPF